ncbi:unnamed protein product [Closterium sp. NIES-65]|nr:unnamed protein product [Closterium sp. NIES-65]
MKGGGWSKGTRGVRGMDQQHQYQQPVAAGRAAYESMDMPNMGMESRDYGQEAAAWADENGNEDFGPVGVKKSRVSSNMGSSTWEMSRQEMKRSRTGEETPYDAQGRSAIPDLQSRSKPVAGAKRESGFYESGAWSNGVLGDRNPNFANVANAASVAGRRVRGQTRLCLPTPPPRPIAPRGTLNRLLSNPSNSPGRFTGYHTAYAVVTTLLFEASQE